PRTRGSPSAARDSRGCPSKPTNAAATAPRADFRTTRRLLDGCADSIPYQPSLTMTAACPKPRNNSAAPLQADCARCDLTPESPSREPQLGRTVDARAGCHDHQTVAQLYG